MQREIELMKQSLRERVREREITRDKGQRERERK